MAVEYKLFQFVLHGPQMDVAIEFIEEMAKDEGCFSTFGMILSGPTGVGKSWAGILAANAGWAQGKFVIYIPEATEWIASAEIGYGDSYFLTKFIDQNADLIVNNEVLAVIFGDYFKGIRKLDSVMMKDLTGALKNHPSIRIGLIVDETDAIAEVLNGRSVAANYFKDWSDWTSEDAPWSSYVRFQITSAPGHFFYFF